MDIKPVEMDRDLECRAAYFGNEGDWRRAAAVIIRDGGYVKAGQTVTVVDDAEIDRRVQEKLVKLMGEKMDATEAALAEERRRIADMFTKRADEIELETDENGEPRKTSANKALSILQSTLREFATKLGGE